LHLPKNEPDNQTGSGMRRVFFAALPDRATRQQLERVLDALLFSAGRKIRPANLHITLAFAGSVDEDQLRCLIAKAESVQPMCLDIKLNRFACFERARVLWMGPAEEDSRLESLANDINQVLHRCGVHLDPRPFVPHVTLVRGARRLPENPRNTEVLWKSNGFALMESVSTPHGVRYTPVRLFLPK